MILIRRLSRSFREQNWVQTGVEFVLLVVGVFLGIQAANWNDDRVRARSEALMLLRIQEDFRAIEPALARTVDRYRTTVDSTGDVILQLRQPEPPEDEVAFRKSLRDAAFLWYVPPISVVYTELNSSGGISGLSDPDLRAALMRYGAAHTLYTQIQPQAKAILNNAQSHFHNGTEWNVDPDTWQGDDAVKGYDWPRLREARGELTLWQGLQYEIANISRRQLDEVRAVLAILDKEAP